MSAGLAVTAELRRGDFHLRVSFHAPPGLTVILGPSGAGKTLTLQTIAGLAPLACGRIALGQRVLADTAAGIALAPRMRHIGYVPQSYALFQHLTVGANIAYGLPHAGPWWAVARRAERATRDAAVAALLDMVRLPGFADRAPRTLSGGEQQRVALARALAAAPDALLLDEPLSAVDAPTRAALQDDMRHVVAASHVPALVVTHDFAEARTLADRLVVLIGGQVVAEGAVAPMLAAPPTAEAALLLGWRNIVACDGVVVGDRDVPSEQADGSVERLARVTLPGGQALVARTTLPGGTMGGALALRADALTLVAGMAGDQSEPCDAPPATDGAGESLLFGTLRAATDMGAYMALRVALDGAPQQAPQVALSCSPREWAAMGTAPGARVGVRVPVAGARVMHSAPWC